MLVVDSRSTRASDATGGGAQELEEPGSAPTSITQLNQTTTTTTNKNNDDDHPSSYSPSPKSSISSLDASDETSSNNNTRNHTEEHMIYDIADEEVHFSRDVLDRYQPFTHTTPTTYYLPSTGAPSTSKQRGNHTIQFTDVNLNSSPSTTDATAGSSSSSSSSVTEQFKSSRLLNSIGNKLRYGSTYYLLAPKLLGEYLLGVTIQSWSEFFNTSHMMKAPSNRQQLTRRLLANLSHFQGNYLCVSFVLIIYCILTSPFLLLAIIAYLAALYVVTVRSAHGHHLRLVGYRFNLQQQYSFLTLISVPLLWVAGAPSAVFWVIGASFVVVGLHASMYGGLSGDRLTTSTTGTDTKLGYGLGQTASYHVTCNSSNLTGALSTTGAAAGFQNPFKINHSTTDSFVQYNQLPTNSTINNNNFSNTDSINNNNNFSYNNNRASVQYYNHYNVNQYSQQQYLPLQSAEYSSSSKSIKENTSKGGSNLFYANSLASWMMFGGNKSSSSSSLNKNSKKEETTSRTPEVTIISQDFAGLGRVYEV